MKKIIFALFAFSFICGIQITSNAQAAETTRSSKSKLAKEIEFKYRYARENHDYVKLFITGDLQSIDTQELSKQMNNSEGISNFTIRDKSNGDCTMEISKEMTADQFRTILLSQSLDIRSLSIRVLSKSYFMQH